MQKIALFLTTQGSFIKPEKSLIQSEFYRHLYLKRTILNPRGIEIEWLRGPGGYSP